MDFNISKCNILQVTKYTTAKNFTYHMNGVPLKLVEKIRKQAHLILLYKIVNHLLLVPNRCLPSLNQTAPCAHHDQKFNHIQASALS